MMKRGTGCAATWLFLETNDLAYLVDAVWLLIAERGDFLHVADDLDVLRFRVTRAADFAWGRDLVQAANDEEIGP